MADDRDNSFKGFDKEHIDDLTLEEARGFVIERMNNIEDSLNLLLERHFDPQKNKEHFRTILLNSSVINFGAKAKALCGLGVIDKKLFNEIQTLGSIRNGFAHVRITTHIRLKVSETIVSKDVSQAIGVMSSTGVVTSKDAKTYFRDFINLYHSVDDALKILYSS